MTGTCGEPIIFCDKPEGHEGYLHHAEWPMPPEARMMVNAAIDDYEKRAKMYRRWTWFFVVATVLNIIGAISTLT